MTTELGPGDEPAEFFEGGRAFIEGDSSAECPYLITRRGSERLDPDEVKAKAWLRGWDCAWRMSMRERAARFAAAPKLPRFPLGDD